MATTIKNRGVRFLVTRIITGAVAAGLFVSLWAGVAISAAAPDGAATASGDTSTAAAQGVIEQDGWRWDPDALQWVAIAEAAATPDAVVPAAALAPMQQVIVIERQPVYYTTVVQQVPGGPALVPTTAGAPAASLVPGAVGSPVAAGAVAAAIAAAAAGVPAAPANVLPDPPTSAVPAYVPPEPISVPAAPAPVPAPPPPPKPAAPPPAPKPTKAS